MKLALPVSRTLGLGGLLFELAFPTVFSASLLLALAGYTRFWDLHSPGGLSVFAVLLVVLSLFVSLRLDVFTLARRRERGRTQILNRADSRSRLAKFLVGGLAIPIGAFVAANRLQLPNHQTPMAQAVQWRLQRPESVHAEQIVRAVLRAPHPADKVQGILALQALGTDDALDQLLRLLKDDPTALSDGGESQALSKALASYGVRAKTKLLQRFAEVAPGSSSEAGTAPDAPDQTKRLERLQAARTDLEQSLRQVESDGPPSSTSIGSLPSFVLRTLLQMDLKQDPEILEAARRVGADARWSTAVRGQALLLIAKLGGADNMDELFGYLENPDPRLQARAMQAIAALQSKVSPAAATR